MLTFPLLTLEELAQARALLTGAQWEDGRSSAGEQAALAKQNEQLPPGSESARRLQAMVLQALERSPRFLATALPRRIYPPRFNRYTPEAPSYGPHVDSAIRFAQAGVQVRTDLSCTVFLTEPTEYDGGELVTRGPDGERSAKLPAGHAVLYPGTSVHEVLPVKRGVRIASFFWVESLVRDAGQRQLLLEMDDALTALRQQAGDSPATVSLMGTYHNLLRMWAQT